jgi:hypothetical protein
MATVERMPALEEVVKSLKTKYSIALADVQPDRIFYLQSDGKSRTPIRLAALRLPHQDLTPFRFVMTVFTRLWNELDEAHQIMYIHREILRINGFEEGKLSRFPIQDFPEILAKYGIDWESKLDLPNILEEK